MNAAGKLMSVIALASHSCLQQLSSMALSCNPVLRLVLDKWMLQLLNHAFFSYKILRKYKQSNGHSLLEKK